MSRYLSIDLCVFLYVTILFSECVLLLDLFHFIHVPLSSAFQFRRFHIHDTNSYLMFPLFK